MKIPLVIFSSQDWDGLPTRKHRFAKAISSARNPVLFIEAPFTWLSKYRDKKVFHPKAKKSGKVEKINDNLWVASPPAMMPFYGRAKIFQNCACKTLVKFTKKVLKKIDFPEEFTTLFYLPWMNPIREMIHPKISVYDCVDDHKGYGGTQSEKFMDKVEGELAGGCSVVFATAKFLKNNLIKFNKNTVYMPNAVDPDLFKPSAEVEIVKNIPKPRVVYAGALRWWFNSELMHKVATTLPNVSFIIIGGERGSELGKVGKKLRELPNVHFLGRKNQEELPSLMSGAVCGIIPFRDVELTKSVSPLKLYEYAAMGLPTVSVPMDELVDFPGGVVTIAKNADEFISEIKKLTEKKPDKNVLAEFVKKNSWDDRIKKFTGKLEELWAK